MEFDKMAKELMAGKNGNALRSLTQSPDGARLAARFDGAAIEKAAREGDMRTLSALLQGVLATPEGRSFAERVQKTVNGDGR